MNRPRLIRGLRIAVSAVCGILCVLLVILWVRSYRYTDMEYRVGSDGVATNVVSDLGNLHIDRSIMSDGKSVGPPTFWNIDGYVPSKAALAEAGDRPWVRTRFRWEASATGFFVMVPHWFLVTCFGFAAAIPWLPQFMWRFSLRTLLIVTTLIAVVLGLGVWAVKG